MFLPCRPCCATASQIDCADLDKDLITSVEVDLRHDGEFKVYSSNMDNEVVFNMGSLRDS